MDPQQLWFGEGKAIVVMESFLCNYSVGYPQASQKNMPQNWNEPSHHFLSWAADALPILHE